MRVKRYMAIDPGIRGAICIITSRGKILEWWNIPSTERAQWHMIKTKVQEYKPAKAYIERINTGYSGLGGRSGKSQMAKLYGNYMATKMALRAAGLVYEEVQPRTWQKAVGFKSKSGEARPERKSRLKKLSEKLFGKIETVTNKNCDCFLIGRYAVLTNR